MGGATAVGIVPANGEEELYPAAAPFHWLPVSFPIGSILLGEFFSFLPSRKSSFRKRFIFVLFSFLVCAAADDLIGFENNSGAAVAAAVPFRLTSSA